MKVSFDFAALHYLNLWLRTDREVCRLLHGTTDEEKRKGIAKAAADYRIARNVPKRFDEGRNLPRFQPILITLKTVAADQFMPDRLPAILRIRNDISGDYGNREMLSLTTKLLWFKLKSPIIMYDRQVREALGTKSGDLKGFYAAWEAEFSRHRQEIDDACSTLVDVRRYAIDQNAATAEYIAGLAAQPWFKGRVLDVYLWHSGVSP